MANIIQIKRKTTTGAPTLGDLADGEFCLVVPDETLYQRVDGSTLINITALVAHGHDTETIVVGDHGTETTDEVVNVCYGTSSTPPTASTTTEGALYLQYTA